MKKNIFIAGHKGMVGSAILRKLDNNENIKLITADRAELDLSNQFEVNNFFKNNKIDEIYLAAAKVGGILANDKYPADFIYQNLMIECNIINAAHQNEINDLLFLGSSCIYPKFSEQPIIEESLLTGPLEATNEPYAIAKIAGIKLCESFNRQYNRNYRSVMPTNLYGPGDNYHEKNSHVIPALIRRFHEAKINSISEVVVWGSGNPRREFLYVDDMADACIHVMSLPAEDWISKTSPMCSHLNIGCGVDHSIAEVAQLIATVVGYTGTISFDRSKPDGTPRKLMSSQKMEDLHWSASIDLKLGLMQTYDYFLACENNRGY